MTRATYPIHLSLIGRRALVVGAGRVATRKIERLVETRAEVRVVARDASAPIRKLAAAQALTLEIRDVVEADVPGSFLVIAATDNAAVNTQVALWARAHGALISRVDAPDESDFTIPAFVRGEHVEATVSTYGRAPSASRRLGRELSAWAASGPDRFAGEVARVRRALEARSDARTDATERLRRLNESGLFEACARGDEPAIHALVAAALEERT
jgi:siroheme synthase-like protein